MASRARTAFITGASRGIGLEIGKALARQGCNVVIAAKTVEPHPKLPGTIYTAAEEINQIGQETKAGAKGLAIQLDVRDDRAVQDAIDQTVKTFGGLDIVINNASAINMKPTIEASVKSYDLINSINSRGTWLVSRFALPHLLTSRNNPHILTLSPPLTYSMFSTNPSDGVFPSQFKQTASAYTMAKFGMSLCTLSLAAEVKGTIAVNSLWPYTLIGTSAMKIVSSSEHEKHWRSPTIVSEAAVRILNEPFSSFTGNFVIHEIYLRRNHLFSDSQIDSFSLTASQTDLSEDLYISQPLRDDLFKARQGN